MCPATYDWGTIEEPKFDSQQLRTIKKGREKHCFSTLNHNLGYCYNDARDQMAVEPGAQRFSGRCPKL